MNMRYIKLFDKKTTMDETIDPNWSTFTKEMHKQYWEKCKPYEDKDFPLDDIKPFFKDLEDEYLNTDYLSVYKVQLYLTYDEKPNLLGITKAQSPLHAIIKIIILEEDAWLIEEDIQAHEVSEEEIDSKIKTIKQELKKWETIY